MYCRELINYNGIPIKRGIHADNKHKGKVFAVGSKWTAPDGKEYRTITFKTFKGGEYSETFNEWNETHDHDAVICVQRPPAIIRTQSKQPPKSEAWRVKAFNEAAAAFEQASDDVTTHPYIVSKNVNTDGLDIRRGIGKHGDCVMVAMRNMDGVIVGYQQIYTDKIPDKDTNKLFFIKNEGDKRGLKSRWTKT